MNYILTSILAPILHNNVTSTLEDTPSLLEIIESNEIEDLFTPAARYAVAQLTSRFPNKYTFKIHNSFEEWWTLYNLIIGYKFLNSGDNATFIEKNYGLQRYNTANTTGKLTLLQIMVILYEKNISQYLVNKLDRLYASILKRKFETKINPTTGEYEVDDDYTYTLLESLFIKYWPIFQKLWKILNFGVKLLFLKKLTKSTTLLDNLFSVGFRRFIEKEEPHTKSSNDNNLIPINNRLTHYSFSSNKILKYIKSVLSNVKSNIGSRLFIIIIYAIQVIQHYNSQDLLGTIKKKLNDIDRYVPTPLAIYNNSRHYNDDSSHICRLCNSTITNPAMLETGYVFCYPCIVGYLNDTDGDEKEERKREKKCPVTGRILLHNIENSVRKLLI
ncbi:ubiquitin-protein ligase peroxin 12 SCDLUD_004181 [Saccharomycodes ludwigii]|uniref:ubiquitin-protein ligase peroxin 12 n=1 Tax=Saccharomycodes ludwigii TaxID=36035 RepID=UPI001E84E63D|nr:hypothetical protein SCDLUD_004181 [Saccharomycodes ludwigii]KAH3899881.1 hypothetical protein SCDLUD_004181 [Saccharomycodes ludwigii]